MRRTLTLKRGRSNGQSPDNGSVHQVAASQAWTNENTRPATLVEHVVMPRYTVENTSKLGKPCKVFDAEGRELEYVVGCDTETGEVEQLIWNAERQQFETTEAGDALARSTTFYPKPLRVEFVDS